MTFNGPNTESLHLNGLDAADIFNVMATVDTSVFVDGGNPIGQTGDKLNFDSGGPAFTVESGPQNDEGGFNTVGRKRVSFDHIEEVSAGGGPAGVLGTNGDDVITIIARDSSTHAGADGVQDFTVSVNDGPDILFLNMPTFNVSALNGSDEIVVIAPAPNNAVWNVQLTIDGGAPPQDSDKVVLGTPGLPDTVIFSPTDQDSATLNIVNLTSLITMNNVEKTVYSGQGGNDNLTVTVPRRRIGNQLHARRHGRRRQYYALRLSVAGTTLMPLDYNTLGVSGSVTFDVNNGGRFSGLDIHGTAADDQFNLTSTATGTVANRQAHLRRAGYRANQRHRSELPPPAGTRGR